MVITNSELKKFDLVVGDEVIMVGQDPNGCVHRGERGYVCHYRKFSDGCNIGVRWERVEGSRHDCFGHCDHGHGRYVPHSAIEKVLGDLGDIAASDMPLNVLLE